MIKLLVTLISFSAYLTLPLCVNAAELEPENQQNHLELWKTEIDPDRTLAEQAGAIVAQGANIVGQIGNGCYQLYNASTQEKSDLCTVFCLQMVHTLISAPVDTINYTPCTLFLIVVNHLWNSQHKLSASELAYRFLFIQGLILAINVVDRLCSVTERMDFCSQMNPIDENKYSSLHASDISSTANPLVKGLSVDTYKPTLHAHKQATIKKIANLKFKRLTLQNKSDAAYQSVIHSASYRRKTGKLRVVGQPQNYFSCVKPFIEDGYPNILSIIQKINAYVHSDSEISFIADLEQKINNIGNSAVVNAPNFAQLSADQKAAITAELKTRIYNAPAEYQHYIAENWTAFIAELDRDCRQENVRVCLSEFIDIMLDTNYYTAHSAEIDIMRTKYKVRNLTDLEIKRAARQNQAPLRQHHYFTDFSTDVVAQARITRQKEKELALIETYNRDILVDLFVNQCHQMVISAKVEADHNDYDIIAPDNESVPVADYIDKYLRALGVIAGDVEAKVNTFMQEDEHSFLTIDDSRDFTFDYTNKLQCLSHLFEADSLNDIQVGADEAAYQALIEQRQSTHQGTGFEQLKQEYVQENPEDQSTIGLWNFIQGKKRDLYLQVSGEAFVDTYLDEALYQQSFSDGLVNPLLYGYKNILDSIPSVDEN
jgi:hypothetical protein